MFPFTSPDPMMSFSNRGKDQDQQLLVKLLPVDLAFFIDPQATCNHQPLNVTSCLETVVDGVYAFFRLDAIIQRRPYRSPLLF